MNKRQVIILWVIAIVLGAAVAAVKLTQKDTTKSATNRAPGQTLFESFPAADIASRGNQGRARQRSPSPKRTANGPSPSATAIPANATYVNDFIRTLAELKVTRGMEAGPSFAPRFGMDESAAKAEDRGLTATFKDASGKELAKVSLGKNIESGADAGPMGGGGAVGRYIRNHADESGFYAVSEMFPSVSAEAARWLADDFISPEKIKSISLSQKDKDDTAWKLTRDTEEAEFKLEGAAGERSARHHRHHAAQEPVLLRPLRRCGSRRQGGRARRCRWQAHRRDRDLRGLHLHPHHHSRQARRRRKAMPHTASEDVLLTVTVTAELPKERKKEEGEKPEDAKTKDAAFTERLKTLTEKLDKEKAFDGRTFLVAKTHRGCPAQGARPTHHQSPAPAGGRCQQGLGPTTSRRHHRHPAAPPPSAHRHHPADRSGHSADRRASAGGEMRRRRMRKKRSDACQKGARNSFQCL